MAVMFERFTERARQVVTLSQEEARDLQHNYIGTEHMLLGLIREEEGLAARVLESHEILIEKCREQIVKIIGEGQEKVEGQIPFTPRAKKVFEISLREALSLGHNYIGTEHLLLGLVREHEGVAARMLCDLMDDNFAETLRNDVIRMLSGPRYRQQTARAQEAAQTVMRQSQADQEGTLSRALLTPYALKKLKVQHRRKPDFKGLLVDYDWHNDRCTVAYTEPVAGGMEGTFNVQRSELNVVNHLHFSVVEPHKD